ncbi:YgiW/YdeI family stress tolerance OB fold protein [Vibrio sp. TRT 21S02]|uniref:YgiW/YdeI family stress tolerance OB fold protein n=1 Tax=Vibrio sp. TRT 21S02 TaxID=3418507 RepID=UPI003CE79656
MKKLLLVSITLIASAMANASTETITQPAGGFSGPGSERINTVQAASEARDDSAVELTGSIVKSLGDERYLFRDATGEMEVEIDHDKWAGQEVTPQDKVQLFGEVDSEWNKKSVDVDVIKKL